MKLIFLGTGTSNGVPILGCKCPTCRSTDPRDQRFRNSAYIETNHGTKLLIDISPDFRLQGLRQNIDWVDGILLTHGHYDHIGGIDELRQLNFLMKQPTAIYTDAATLYGIQTRFNYIFKKTQTQKGGGKTQLTLHQIETYQEFSIKEQKILPIQILHGKLSILGFILDDLTYITDASDIPPETIRRIQSPKALVINTLRFRPHSTHFHLDQTLEMIHRLRPEKAYLIHVTHDIQHAEVQKMLPENVYLAYDNLEITM